MQVPTRQEGRLTDTILDHPFWYHRIDLGDGFYTPGFVDAHKYHELGLPDDLSGKSVLDIGSFNGLFAFEAERRGADYVLATDLWDADTREEAPEQTDRRSGFELAHASLDSDVEARSIDLMDVSPETVGGTFDIVLCPGVIYRLKHLTVGVESLVSVADECVVLTSMYPRADLGTPGMEFYEGADRLNDPSIWWMPDEECLAGLLRSAGCARVETAPIPPDVTDDSTPPVETAVVPDQPVDVYRDHELTDRVDRRRIRDTGREPPSDVEGGPDTVLVLHRTDVAARVMYTVETGTGMVERRQGWVALDALDVDGAAQGSLAEAALRRLRSDGVGEFLRRSVSYALDREEPREYVVHAYVD